MQQLNAVGSASNDRIVEARPHECIQSKGSTEVCGECRGERSLASGWPTGAREDDDVEPGEGGGEVFVARGVDHLEILGAQRFDPGIERRLLEEVIARPDRCADRDLRT